MFTAAASARGTSVGFLRTKTERKPSGGASICVPTNTLQLTRGGNFVAFFAKSVEINVLVFSAYTCDIQITNQRLD